MKIYIAALLFIICALGYAQEDSAEPEIDASKPTNFYSFIDNNLELTAHENHNVFGYRGKLTFALSEAHLLLAEIPLLYNDMTSKFGLGDLRARYFWLPYKNYDKVLGAFGPSIDVFAPTGSFENGLGSGRWIISPGITVGLMAADWIQFFPILSYQYASKPVYDNPPAEANNDTHGITFQVLVPIVFSDKFFVQITPNIKFNNIQDEREDRYIQELFASYSLNPKMQLTCFYNGNFTDNIHQMSLGLSVFF